MVELQEVNPVIIQAALRDDTLPRIPQQISLFDNEPVGIQTLNTIVPFTREVQSGVHRVHTIPQRVPQVNSVVPSVTRVVPKHKKVPTETRRIQNEVLTTPQSKSDAYSQFSSQRIKTEDKDLYTLHGQEEVDGKNTQIIINLSNEPKSYLGLDQPNTQPFRDTLFDPIISAPAPPPPIVGPPAPPMSSTQAPTVVPQYTTTHGYNQFPPPAEPSLPSYQAVPQNPVNNYAAPQVPQTPQGPPSYQVPQVPQNPPSYGVPQAPQNPTNDYGIPQSPPQNPPSYGVPQTPQNPTNDYGIPQAPPQNYGAPQAPPQSYGVPQAPPQSYGVPQAPPTYEVPNTPPQDEIIQTQFVMPALTLSWQQPTVTQRVPQQDPLPPPKPSYDAPNSPTGVQSDFDGAGGVHYHVHVEDLQDVQQLDEVFNEKENYGNLTPPPAPNSPRRRPRQRPRSRAPRRRPPPRSPRNRRPLLNPGLLEGGNVSEWLNLKCFIWCLFNQVEYGENTK